MIAVVDYGLGNVQSVVSALEHLGASAAVTNDPAAIVAADRIVLPGVGSFRTAMANIDRLNLRAPILEAVRQAKRPILGICLGMQILADEGDEDGTTAGLGLVPGKVSGFSREDRSLRVPHIGFNAATFVRKSVDLFEGLGDAADFYFIHSYWMRCDDPADVSSTCEYGGRFTASVQRDHVFGTQFHPEKSQTNGLRVLANFLRVTPC